MTKFLFTFCFFVALHSVHPQDILAKLEKEYPNKPVYELATFKTTRIGLGHSVEVRKKGALEISAFNRFWNTENSTKQRFLADKLSTRFGLNYAITDLLTIGAGYTSFDEITDGFLKYKILRQQKDAKKAPVSITLLQGVSHRTKADIENPLYAEDNIINSNVYSFVSQVLIARKFSRKFSAQITPTYIHRTDNFLTDQSNNQFAIGLGARYKLGGHVSLVSEYYYVANPASGVTTFDPFLIGVNWELSHLLLQFHMTNTRHFAEDAFITQNRNNFNFHDGNFHFGFNAIFVLHSKKNKL